ncbi:MAG: glycosylhydrolase-like jelly roll fold domain-containing protein [Acutalibacter sp.]|jgi:hypothetical protein
MDPILQAVWNDQPDNYLLPFFWQHEGNREGIPEKMEKIFESGCRAVCVESRPFEGFCQDSWWETLGLILEEAKKRDMKVWILDAKHYPTGDTNGVLEAKYPELRRWYLREHHVDVMGPAPDTTLLIPPCQEQEEEQLLQVCAFRRTTEGEGMVGEPVVIPTKPGLDYLYWDVPQGCWRVFFLYKTRQGCQEATRWKADLLSRQSVAALIEGVYEPHYQHFGEYFGNTLAGFFSDEPGLDCQHMGPWGEDTGGYFRRVGEPGLAIPWAEEIPTHMEKSGLAHPLALLPALWYPWKDNGPQVRLTYMDGVTKLWQENFSHQVGGWCRAHKVQYIGHIIEDMNAHARVGRSAGHFFRGLDGQDMSGIDIVLHQVMPGMGEYQTAARVGGGMTDPEFFHYVLGQLAASQARQNPIMEGRAMCEVFGAYGWAEGSPVLKWLMDFLLVRGINHFVPHAFDDFFPDRDCPPHFWAEGNDPQFDGFSQLMHYTNRAAHLLYGAQMEAAGAVLYHAEAEWMDKDHVMFTQKPAKACYDAHIPYEIVPLDYLEQASASHGVFGKGYRFLVVPSCAHLPKSFWQAARRLEQAGIPLFFVEPAPSREGKLPGKAVSLEELPRQLLALGLAHDYSAEEPLLRIARFTRNAMEYFFLFNEAPRKAEETLRFPVSGEYLALDLLNQTCLRGRAREGRVSLSLEPGQSVILIWGGFTHEEWESFPELPHLTKAQQLDLLWDISVRESGQESTFRPFRTQAPLCNVTGQNGLPHFSGEIRYRTTAKLEPQGRTILDLGRVGMTARLFVNGQDLGQRICAPYSWDITQSLVPGENQLEVVAANSLANRIHDSFSHYMSIPASGVQGPITLKTEA